MASVEELLAPETWCHGLRVGLGVWTHCTRATQHLTIHPRSPQTQEEMILKCMLILVLAFAQNISFSLVSRSRNRDNMNYHIIASVFSNGVWFMTFRHLVTNQMDWWLFVPYTIGTVAGSVTGVKISMVIERLLGATSDGHLKKSDK
jgi:hypothetical protein